MWRAALLGVVVIGDRDAVDSSLRTHDVSDTSSTARNGTLDLPGAGEGIFAVERKMHLGKSAAHSFVQIGSGQSADKPLEWFKTEIETLKSGINRESKIADALRLSLESDQTLVGSLGLEIDTSEKTIYQQVTRQYNNAADVLNRASIVDASLAENGNNLGATLNVQMTDSEVREKEMVGSQHEVNSDYVNAMNIYEEMKGDSNRLTAGIELQSDWMTKADTVIEAQRLAIMQLEGWIGHLEGQIMQVRGVCGWLADYLKVPEEMQDKWDFLRDGEYLEIQNDKPVFVTPNDPELVQEAKDSGDIPPEPTPEPAPASA